MRDYIATGRTLGAYRAGETCWILTSKWYRPDGTRRGILFCHGASSTPSINPCDATICNNTRLIAYRLAQAGYPVAMCDFGNPALYQYNTWGNDDQIAAIGAAWSYLKTTAGAKTDKVGFLMSSMGNTALSWVRANLSSTFAVMGSIPALDPNDIYVNAKTGPGGFDHRTAIGNAYGVTYPTALPGRPTHCPADFGATDLAGLPMKFYAASDDPLACTYAAVLAWGGKGGVLEAVNMGAVGHTEAPLQNEATYAEQVQWFDQHGGRS